jgi:hypothetical protein
MQESTILNNVSPDQLTEIIWGLYDNALKVISDNLESENIAIKSKTAFWLIEKIDKIEVGQTDPREWIKRDSMLDTTEWMFNLKLDKENTKNYARKIISINTCLN